MNSDKVVSELIKQHPNTNIVKNSTINPSEIICELGTQKDASGLAIAVIDQSAQHVHNRTTETYEILKGELTVYKNDKKYILKKGQRLIIHPGEIHRSEGNETWVKVISIPPWSQSDHILVNQTNS